ncbi:MAG: hypothetical protein GQ534_03040 [Candidatus Delongbacteria bacterium]|nr:hypothetical protein [Candidatus Delongbacteria bacterium]
MFKLITADMKVLGHRLWIIPVGLFLFVTTFSFIPYLNQVQSFQYLIFISLIPALLLYELFRENHKNNSEIMVMTMPIDRKKIVYSKYLLLFGFIMIGFVAGLISKELITFFNIGLNNNFVDPMSKDMLFALTFILRVGLFIIPIYHYTRKLNLSFFAGIIGYFLILAGYFELYYEVFGWTWFGDRVISHLSNISIVISIALIIHLVVKYKFKGISKEKIVNGWFIVLAYLTTVTLQLLIKNLIHFDLYLRLKKICGDLAHLYTAEQLEKYHNLINQYNEYLLMVGLSFIVLTLALILIHRKAENKFFQYAVLFVMLPIFMIIFGEYSYDFFTWNFRRFHSYEAYVIVKNLFSYLNLIIGVFISVKVSIYLLKNNRTL